MEDASRSTLTNASEQVVNSLNNMATRINNKDTENTLCSSIIFLGTMVLEEFEELLTLVRCDMFLPGSICLNRDI
jgi:hypothetical protein